ncbi:MAG TPA: Mov34/MPN/PAD-1 family protein [Pyrinomonadaceae bacterium]|nr:Mov34/MPN/PAD-1 family protein [Pyrinomonadaceae bacterium]
MEEFFRPKEKNAYASLPFITRPQQDETFISFASESDAFEVFLHRNVQEVIRHEAHEAAPNETIGLLAGRVVRDERGPYTLVLAAAGARPDEVEATPSHVRISANGQAQVRGRLESSAHGLDIIGWYHSHPRFPARFSPVDITEQSTWRDPNHVGIVISGVDRNEPLGVYRGPKANLLIPKSSLQALIRPKQSSEMFAVVPQQRPGSQNASVEPAVVNTTPAPAHIAEPIPDSTTSETTTVRASKIMAFIYFAVGLGLLTMLLEIVWLDRRLDKMEARLTSSRSGREQTSAPPQPSPSLLTAAPPNASNQQDVPPIKLETGAKPLPAQSPTPKRRLTPKKLTPKKKDTGTAGVKNTPAEKQDQ